MLKVNATFENELGEDGLMFTAEMTVAEVLAEMPQALGVFVEHGFTALREENVRTNVARTITVAGAAMMNSVDPGQLVSRLNDLRQRLLAAGEEAAASSGKPITAAQAPGAIIEECPHLLDVFVRNGFEVLRDEGMRRSVAKMVTLETACRMHGVNLELLLAELNAKR